MSRLQHCSKMSCMTLRKASLSLWFSSQFAKKSPLMNCESKKFLVTAANFGPTCIVLAFCSIWASWKRFSLPLSSRRILRANCSLLVYARITMPTYPLPITGVLAAELLPVNSTVWTPRVFSSDILFFTSNGLVCG